MRGDGDGAVAGGFHEGIFHARDADHHLGLADGGFGLGAALLRIAFRVVLCDAAREGAGVLDAKVHAALHAGGRIGMGRVARQKDIALLVRIHMAHADGKGIVEMQLVDGVGAGNAGHRIGRGTRSC